MGVASGVSFGVKDMARPRKPTKVLELNGTFKNTPKRKKARENEPVVEEGIGKHPCFLNEEQIAAWNWIVSVAPEGVLTSADAPFVANLSVLQAQIMTGDAPMGAYGLLQAGLGKLGMTPADRSKVSVPQKPKQNRWSSLAK